MAQPSVYFSAGRLTMLQRNVLDAAGMERLILKAKSVDCWGTKQPNILVVAPPPIGAGFHDAVMGDGCVEKSAGVAEQLRIICERQGGEKKFSKSPQAF